MQLQNSTKDQLRTIVARIERLEEEKAALAADPVSYTHLTLPTTPYV